MPTILRGDNMKRKEPIAVYPLTNTLCVTIYDVKYGVEDEVLAGINNNRPDWFEITDENSFFIDDIEVLLAECLRV
jgi:hypothetical protein